MEGESIMINLKDLEKIISALTSYESLPAKDAWDELKATAFLAEHHLTIRLSLEHIKKIMIKEIDESWGFH